MLWKTSQFLCSLKLCLCLFFPVCTGPQVYPELRHWGPLRSFLGMYAALLMAGLLDLQEYVRAFQSPLWIYCFSALPCKLLARLLFALTGITVSSSYSDKQLIFINFFFLTDALGIGIFLHSKCQISTNEWGFSWVGTK